MVATQFINSIGDVKMIKSVDSHICDCAFTEQEILKSTELLKNNDSPGKDGLVGEFYKSFSVSTFVVTRLYSKVLKGALFSLPHSLG